MCSWAQSWRLKQLRLKQALLDHPAWIICSQNGTQLYVPFFSWIHPDIGWFYIAFAAFVLTWGLPAATPQGSARFDALGAVLLVTAIADDQSRAAHRCLP